MMVNKGGRPAHHKGEIKKAAIAVRTAPSIRDALKVAADAQGRSVTQEVESRLAASFDRDAGMRSAETEMLLNKISAEIAEIEATTGKHWHKDRMTAGAVKEMLDNKPRQWIDIDNPHEDEFVQKAWSWLYNIRQERAKLEGYLPELGVQLVRSPDGKQGLPGRGQLGGIGSGIMHLLNADGTFRADSAAERSSRWRERQILDQLDLSEEVQAAALGILNRLEDLDRDEAAAKTEYDNQMRPYVEAENEGRAMYRKARARRAYDAFKHGDFSSLDWVPF